MVLPRTLLEDFERQPFADFHSGGAENRADGFGRAALAADYFSEIARIDAQLENGYLFAFDCTHLHLIWIVNERFRNRLNEIFHLNLQRGAVSASAGDIARTNPAGCGTSSNCSMAIGRFRRSFGCAGSCARCRWAVRPCPSNTGCARLRA